MRLRRIDLPGFGCLRDFRADFVPGINVVFGLNEAGKSTLQQAISAMLYGFYDGERGKADEKRRHERFRPWADGREVGAAFRGTLEYQMENGDEFEVRRDFSSPDLPTQLIDLALGSDVTSRFGQGRHGNVPFARTQLGMSRGVFQSCAFIAQGEIFDASQGASPREIGDAIAAMADSARRDVSASAALSRLDGLMLKIGSDRARTAELPKARENLRGAQAELVALDAVRQSVSERARELERTQSRIGDVSLETVHLQVQYLLARRKSLSRRVAALTEAETAKERASADRERLAAYESFPAELRDRVVALSDRRQGAASRASAAQKELAARAVSDEVRLEFEALSVSVGQLSADSIADLERAAYVPPPAIEAPSGLVARLAASLVAALKALAARILRRRITEEMDSDSGMESASTVFAGTQEEAVQLLERHRRYLMLRPAIEAQEGARASLDRERGALSATMEELTGILGADAANDIDTAVAAFLDGCARRAEYEAALAAESEAEDRCETLLSGRTRGDIETMLDQTSSRLETLLAAHPEVETLDTNETAAAIEERIKVLEGERHELEVASARLEEELRAAMGDHRARADVEEDVERWRREVAHLERRRASAQIAREVIDEAMTAVYRDFAPAVSSFLSDGFTHVTEGRYQRALVDPRTLEVSLLLPETHQVIKDPPVSRGTLALAYILMRIGLAQHMSAVAEPVPLVLDDPFVDLDERRMTLTLDFIGELSERMQIFLFTKDPAIARWLETSVPADRHRLQTLSRIETPAAAV